MQAWPDGVPTTSKSFGLWGVAAAVKPTTQTSIRFEGHRSNFGDRSNGLRGRHVFLEGDLPS
jgi:hypothetical protein